MKFTTHSVQLTVFLFAVFAMFNLSAKPFLVDGKLVFDNFDNWTWNEERGGFTNPDKPGHLRGGDSLTKREKKYGKAAMSSISKAQREINIAHQKWQSAIRGLDKMRKKSKQQWWQDEKKSAESFYRGTFKNIRKKLKEKPKPYIIKNTKKKTVYNDSYIWFCELSTLKSKQKKYKKKLDHYNNYESIFQTRINKAKKDLHTAYLNMATIKSKAISAQNKTQ